MSAVQPLLMLKMEMVALERKNKVHSTWLEEEDVDKDCDDGDAGKQKKII